MLCFGLVLGGGERHVGHTVWVPRRLPWRVEQRGIGQRQHVCASGLQCSLIPLPDNLQGLASLWFHDTAPGLSSHSPFLPITSHGPAQTPGSQSLENRSPAAPLPTPIAHPASPPSTPSRADEAAHPESSSRERRT